MQLRRKKKKPGALGEEKSAKGEANRKMKKLPLKGGKAGDMLERPQGNEQAQPIYCNTPTTMDDYEFGTFKRNLS